MALNCYYAHPVSLYGTEHRPNAQEQRDIATLTALGFTVMNPNSTEHSEGYAKKGMWHFADVIQQSCQVLAFRAFQDDTIPAGVMAEIGYARDHGLPVIELPTNVARRGLNVELTRAVLKELGVR
jgi:hypothetical protein